jgi:hypothetical protein
MKIDILATLVCSGNPITHNLKASTALSSPEQVNKSDNQNPSQYLTTPPTGRIAAPVTVVDFGAMLPSKVFEVDAGVAGAVLRVGILGGFCGLEAATRTTPISRLNTVPAFGRDDALRVKHFLITAFKSGE